MTSDEISSIVTKRSVPREREARHLARIRIEVWFEEDDGTRPLLFIEEASTRTATSSEPYGSLAEVDALLGHAKTALGGQARELAVQLKPQEVNE